MTVMKGRSSAIVWILLGALVILYAAFFGSVHEFFNAPTPS